MQYAAMHSNAHKQRRTVEERYARALSQPVMGRSMGFAALHAPFFCYVYTVIACVSERARCIDILHLILFCGLMSLSLSSLEARALTIFLILFFSCLIVKTPARFCGF